MANSSVTVNVGAGDGFLRRSNSGVESWATMRNSTTASTVGPTSTADFGVTARKDSYLYRSFYPLNLGGAGIPAGAAVTAVTLYVWVTAKASGGGGTTANNSVTVVEATPASNTTLATSDYDNVGSTEWVSSRTAFSAFTTGAYNAFTLNAAGVAAANTSINGYIVPALRSGYDLDDVAPSPDTAISDIEVRYSEHATSGNRPYAVVEYSAPRTTADSWAWSDAAYNTAITIGGVTTLRSFAADTWGWSDSAAPYWRAKLQPVLVQAEGANTQINAGAGYTLPQATITVDDTSAFPSSGSFVISSSWNQETVTYTGKTSTTFTGCSGGTGTYADNSLVMATDSESHFPQIVALDTTDTPRLLCAYVQKPGHGGSIGAKIAAKISTNGGLTWGTQFTLQNFVNTPQYTGGGFVLQRLLSGRLLMMWYEGDIGTGSAGVVKSYISYSDDDGSSWSSSTQLTSPFHANVCAVGFDGYLDTGSGSNGTYGDFYVTCYGNDSASYDNTATYNRLMKVTDGGAAGTWTSVGTINTLAQLSGRASEEASLTVLDTGTWVSHLRVEVLAPTYTTLDRYQCTSTDKGVTWSGHTRIHDQLANAAVSHQMPAGHLITQGTDYAHGGETITYFSVDRGTTWTDTAAFYRLEASGGTYSIGNGSDFATIPSTLVPGRRVLNVIGQERGNQAGAQVKFQWYEVPNLPLTYDSWAWSDAATRTITRAVATTDTWSWSDAGTRAITRAVASADAWAWSDVANRTVAKSTPDSWAWSDAVVTADQVFVRAVSDAWTWSESASGSVGPQFELWSWSDIATVSTSITGAAGQSGFSITSAVGAEIVVAGVVDASLTFTAVV